MNFLFLSSICLLHLHFPSLSFLSSIFDFKDFSVQLYLICSLISRGNSDHVFQVQKFYLFYIFFFIVSYFLVFLFCGKWAFFTCETVFWSGLKRFLSKVILFASDRWIRHFAKLNLFYTTFLVGISHSRREA